MPKVRFTQFVDTHFGGCYRTPHYIARAGTVYELPENEVSRIRRSWPELIEDAVDDKTEAPAPRGSGTSPTQARDRRHTGGRKKGGKRPKQPPAAATE